MILWREVSTRRVVGTVRRVTDMVVEKTLARVPLPRCFPIPEGVEDMAEGDVWVVRDPEGREAARVTAEGAGWWLIETDRGHALSRCGPEGTCLLTLEAEEEASLDLCRSGDGGVLHHDGHTWDVSPTCPALSTVTVSRLGVDVLRLALGEPPRTVRQTGVLRPEVVLFLTLVILSRRGG